jgi:hypothetical protein
MVKWLLVLISLFTKQWIPHLGPTSTPSTSASDEKTVAADSTHSAIRVCSLLSVKLAISLSVVLRPLRVI